LLLQCELTLEIGNSLRLFLELFAEASVFLAQPIDGSCPSNACGGLDRREFLSRHEDPTPLKEAPQ
jgi:hypothetical protein